VNTQSVEQLFDQAIRGIDPASGRFDIETQCSPAIKSFLLSAVLPRAQRSVGDMLQVFLPSKHPSYIHFDLTDNPQINAFAFKQSSSAFPAGQYFIAYNVGTPLLIYDFFLRLLSFSDILVQIGNPSAEKAEPQTAPKIFTNSLERLHSPGLSTPTVLDMTRRQYAFVLGDMALDFTDDPRVCPHFSGARLAV